MNYLALQDLPNIAEASGPITIDGDLADWADANWIPLSRGYVAGIHPADVAEAYYAAKWSNATNKVYVAVKVRDTSHIFKNDNNGWAYRDTVEIYFHNSPIAPLHYGTTA